MKRRNEMDIYADVLRIAKDGVLKTRIVYGANLNFKIIKRYLKRLMERDLLVYSDKIYSTTEIGLKFLEDYGKLTSMLEGDFLTIDQTVGVEQVV